MTSTSELVAERSALPDVDVADLRADLDAVLNPNP
jgi:hypothetical protein